ncbi:MAG: RNA polymerase sigma factor [Chloroflexi bacterium]|nr:MAG: RNA polymerase sigma factor [Chloroflexota bacterium]
MNEQQENDDEIQEWYKQIEPHMQKIREWVRYQGLAEELIDDFMQDFSSRILKHRKLYPKKWREIRQLENWLFKSAKRAYIDFSKKHKKNCFESIDSAHWDATHEQNGNEQDEPERALEMQEATREANQAVMERVGRLPMRFRQVLILSLIYELSIDEIAWHLKQPAHKLQTTLKDGLRLLRQTWDNENS